MMLNLIKFFIFAIFIIYAGQSAFSQTKLALHTNIETKAFLQKSKKDKEMNLVKLNLLSLPFKNFSLQYERVINQKISASVSLRFMPNTSIPWKNTIKNSFVNDTITEKIIENFRLGNFQLSPEMRIYLGKGYGKGFYFAPYYRYATFNTKGISFEYDDETDENDQTIELSGKMNMNSIGLMIGAQWYLGKSFSLDWWIIGLQYGIAKGSYTGTTDRTMTMGEQADLKDALESFNIPMVDKSVEVFEDGAKLNLKGPVAGLRFGLCLGYRF
jgi:hypothetical protein